MIDISIKSGGSWYSLDAPKVPIQLNLGVRDLRDLSANTAPFSVSFDMAFSANNTRLLRGVQDIAVDETEAPAIVATTKYDFELYKELECRLLDNGALVQSGVLQVTAIDVQNQVYRCVFFGRTASLFGRIKGKSWREIFTDGNTADTVLNHYLTPANIVNSWNLAYDITGGSNPGVLVYMLTDVGHSSFGYESAPAYGNPADLTSWFQPLNPAGGTRNYEGFRPGIQVKWLLKYVIEKVGLFLKPGGFLDSTVHNTDALYMMLGSQHQYLVREPAAGFCVHNSDGSLYAPQVGNDFVFMPFSDGTPQSNVFSSTYPDLSEFFNPGGNVLPTGYYVAPATAAYYFKIGWAVPAADVTANGDAILRIYVNTPSTGVVLVAQGAFIQQDFGGQTNTVGVATFQLFLQVDDTVNIICQVESSDGDLYRVYLTWRLYQIGSTASGNNYNQVDVVSNLPETSVEEWLRALVDKFNLVVETDAETGEVSIEQYEDWLIAAGDPADWTDRVDAEGKFLITPTTQLQSRTVKFQDAPGGDLLNISDQNATGLPKGHTEYNSDSDWSQGERTVGEYFAPFRQSFLPSGVNGNEITEVASNILITQLWNEWENGVQFKGGPPMLAYYHGTTAATTLDGDPVTWYMHDVPTSSGVFPVWSPNNKATNPDFSLDFAVTYQDVGGFVGTPPLGTAQKFWLRYLDEIYDPGSRILDCVAYLRPSDIFNLSFARYVTIQNVQFRLLSIKNYVLGEDGMCDLTLLKTNNGRTINCTLVPDLRSDGVVDWTDAAGHPTTGNAFCCSRYGFIWNATDELCYGNILDPGGPFADRAALPQTTDTDGGRASCICRDGTAEVLGIQQGRRMIAHEFKMTAYSTRSTADVARSVTGQRHLHLGNFASASLDVQFTTVVVSGANLGDTEYGSYTAAIKCESFTSSKIDGTVFQRGSGSTVTAVLTNTSSGTTLELECTGKSGDDEQIMLNVRMVTMDRAYTTVPLFAEFEDEDTYHLENGTPLLWNK